MKAQIGNEMKARIGYDEKNAAKITGKDILTAMDYLEEELVEIQPYEMESRKKKLWQGRKVGEAGRKAGETIKWAVAAAIALCALGSGIVFAASKLRWFSVDNYNNSGQPGYRVEVTPEKVSAEELTGEVRKVEEYFKEEAANGIQPEGDAPHGWVKEFASEREAMDFIGYAGIRECALDLGEDRISEITLRVLGDKVGNMTLVEYTVLQKLPMERELEEIDLYTTVGIYTDQWAHDFMGTADIAPGEDFQGYDYVTQSGKSALVMYPKEQEGVGGWYPMYAYVVDGGVVYGLQLHHYYWEERDAEYAEELLHQWLEQF